MENQNVLTENQEGQGTTQTAVNTAAAPSVEGKKAEKKEKKEMTKEELFESYLKKQLFHQRLHSALIGIFVLIVAITCLYGYSVSKEVMSVVQSVDETLAEAQGVLQQVSGKLDELDMAKINEAIDKTDELIDIAEGTMKQMSEVVDKMSTYTTTLDDMQKQMDGMNRVLNGLFRF